MKTHPVLAKLFHTDILMEKNVEANSCFSQFCHCT